jgi:hypothetical protein
MLNYATVTYDSHENIILPTAAHDAEYYDVCNLQHHFTILKVEVSSFFIDSKTISCSITVTILLVSFRLVSAL